MKHLTRQIPIAFLVIFFSALYVFLIFGLYNHLQIGDADLALYSQHLWFLSQGKFGVASLKGFNILGDHAHPILFFLAPFYKLWPDPKLLLLVQVFGITLGGVPLYFFAKKRLGIVTAFILTTAYFIFFGFQAALVFPFHVATLSVVFLSFMLYYTFEFDAKRLIIFATLAMLCKEDVPLAVFMVGVYLVLKPLLKLSPNLIHNLRHNLLRKLVYSLIRKLLHYLSPKELLTKPLYSYLNSCIEVRIGGLLMAFSAVYFVLATKVIIPHFSGQDYGYAGLDFSTNNLPLKINVLRQLFSQFAYLPLLSPRALFLSAPFFAERFLSPNPVRLNFWLHYTANQGPYLFFGAVLAISNIKKIFKTGAIPILLAGFVLYKGIAANKMYQAPLYTDLLKNKLFLKTALIPAIPSQAFRKIPGEASVCAQSGLIARFSNRKSFRMYPDCPGEFSYYVFSKEAYSYPFSKEELEREISALEKQRRLKRIESNKSLVIFQKL